MTQYFCYDIMRKKDGQTQMNEMMKGEKNMRCYIYCRTTAKGTQSFYMTRGNEEYFLFSQSLRKGVKEYFERGVSLEEAMNCGKSHNDAALIRTMCKLPMYIRYIEKEENARILMQPEKLTGDFKRDKARRKNT